MSSLSSPPSVINYVYNANVPDTLSLSLDPILGNKVPSSTVSKQLTPEQKKRQIAITICAVAIITAVALAIAAYTLPMMPLLYGAVPLLITGLGIGIWHKVTKELNLNIPEDLKEARSALKGLSFEKMIRKHSINEIYEYQLMDEIFSENEFYNAIARIAEAYHDVSQKYHYDLAKARENYLNRPADLTKKELADWNGWKKKEDQAIHAAFQQAVSCLNGFYNGTKEYWLNKT